MSENEEEKPTYWRITIFDNEDEPRTISAEQVRRGTRADALRDSGLDAAAIDARGGFTIEPDEVANKLQADGMIP